MTEQAQKRLLKSYGGRRPSHVMLVTACRILLTTIRSRCQTLRWAACPRLCWKATCATGGSC
jgi:hypothetical protein